MSETWYTLVVYICIMTITTISSMSKTVELEMCKTFAGLQDGLDGKYYHQVDDKLYHWNHTCTWRRNSQVLDSMVFLLSTEMCCKMRDVHANLHRHGWKIKLVKMHVKQFSLNCCWFLIYGRTNFLLSLLFVSTTCTNPQRRHSKSR